MLLFPFKQVEVISDPVPQIIQMLPREPNVYSCFKGHLPLTWQALSVAMQVQLQAAMCVEVIVFKQVLFPLIEV